MKKLMAVVLAVVVGFTVTSEAATVATNDRNAYPSGEFGGRRQDGPIGVCPPETAIGGVLALMSVGMAAYAGTRGQMGETRSARRARHTAIWLAYGAGASFTLGWITAEYYDRRLGIKTYIRF